MSVAVITYLLLVNVHNYYVVPLLENVEAMPIYCGY